MHPDFERCKCVTYSKAYATFGPIAFHIRTAFGSIPLRAQNLGRQWHLVESHSVGKLVVRPECSSAKCQSLPIVTRRWFEWLACVPMPIAAGDSLGSWWFAWNARNVIYDSRYRMLFFVLYICTGEYLCAKALARLRHN